MTTDEKAQAKASDIERWNTWLDGRTFTVRQDTFDAFKRVKKLFNCKLCGRVFQVGDLARWVYCNGTPGQCTGNFFTCGACDGPDVMARAKASLESAMELAKRWNIYGPDWQKDMQRIYERT